MKSFHMLNTLLKRYKSRREIYADFYEKELLQYRHKPINLLQVGVENSIPALHKFLLRANIYCIDKFDRVEPKRFKFLENTRVFWSRCDIDDEYKIKQMMTEIWNKPRFDIIIDNSSNFANTRFNFLKKYCIGNYYIEEGDEVRIAI